MDGLIYLALEYLIWLLLVFAAGVALFVCTVIVLGAAALGSVTGRWGVAVGQSLRAAQRRLAVMMNELEVRWGRAALVTAHSVSSTIVAGRKQG